MRLFAFICTAALSVAATHTVADPCVGATFDRPLEGAINVTSYVSDVPSARFPAFWQEGILDGFRYKILASADGTLRPADPVQEWTIAISCDVSTLTCTLTNDGTPPPDAVAASNAIGQCLLGVEVEEIVPEPEPEIAPKDDAPIAPQTPVATACGSASVSEATDVATLQRLLAMAGEDPGPADGFLGPKTFAAMEVFVEGANWDTSVPDVIALLDARLCGAAN